MNPQQIGRAAYWQGAPLKACPFPKQHMAAHIAWGGGWTAEHDADGGLHAIRHGMARDLQAAGHCEDEAFGMVGIAPRRNQQGTRGAVDNRGEARNYRFTTNQRQCSTDTAARKREDD